MDFLKMLSATVTDAVDAISIANRRLALTNRLKAIDRAETAKAKATYEAIGRYVAANIDALDMEKLQTMKEAAETAEQHAALARSHVEAMRNPAPAAYAPTEESEEEAAEEAVEAAEDAAEEIEEAAEETAPVVEEIVEAVVESVPAEDDAEEAAEDANDSIPFM